MKSFIVLILLIAISACNCQITVYEEGRKGGPVLFRGNIGSKSAWEGSWQTKIVRYPSILAYPVLIGYLKIVNNLHSDYTAATVKARGVGKNYVKIEYYAPAFKGYDYSVEIRAEPLL